MEDRALFERLKADPENAKSSMELASEAVQREHQKALQQVKRPPTAAEVSESAKRFRAIQLQNDLDKQLEQDSIIAQREREISTLVESALEVARPDEATQIRASITPDMLRGMALRSKDYDICEFVNAGLIAIRAAKQLEL
jgi:hypothetical protein